MTLKIYSRQLDDSSLIEKWAQLWPKSRGAAITVISYSLVSIMTSFHDDKPTMQWCYKTLDFRFSKGDRVRFAVCREYFALTTHHTHICGSWSKLPESFGDLVVPCVEPRGGRSHFRLHCSALLPTTLLDHHTTGHHTARSLHYWSPHC